MAKKIVEDGKEREANLMEEHPVKTGIALGLGGIGLGVGGTLFGMSLRSGEENFRSSGKGVSVRSR
jgi:hypothetical protein